MAYQIYSFTTTGIPTGAASRRSAGGGETGAVKYRDRVVINSGPDAGESVPHLHPYLLGKRPLAWPPG